MAATPTTPETKEGAANAPDKTAALATTEAPEKGGAAAAAAPSLWKGLIPALAALVLSLRNILLDAKPPLETTLLRLTVVSVATFAVGWFIFRKMRHTFFEHI